jgi:uncharacterized protein YndB with AHSA1/START domain
MTGETVSATTTISTSVETVFAVLADPSRHAAIDGTGWVSDSPRWIIGRAGQGDRHGQHS